MRPALVVRSVEKDARAGPRGVGTAPTLWRIGPSVSVSGSVVRGEIDLSGVKPRFAVTLNGAPPEDGFFLIKAC